MLLACDYVLFIYNSKYSEKLGVSPPSALYLNAPARKKSKTEMVPSQEIYLVNMNFQVMLSSLSLSVFLANGVHVSNFNSITTKLSSV